MKCIRTDRPTQRWRLSGTSTNEYGVTHFTVTSCDLSPDEDYAALVRVLAAEFGAVEDGELVGPYSVHRYMKLDGLRFGIILDDPGRLDLYATSEPEKGAMARLVTEVLDALNSPSADQSGREMRRLWGGRSDADGEDHGDVRVIG